MPYILYIYIESCICNQSIQPYSATLERAQAMRTTYGCCCMLLAVAVYCLPSPAPLFGSGPAWRDGCPLPSVLSSARSGWLPAVAAVVQGGQCAALAADHVGGWVSGPVRACTAACCLRCCLWLMRSGPASVALAALLFSKKDYSRAVFMSCVVHCVTISNKNICQMWYIFMLKTAFRRSTSIIV